jgi:hypothetical protein
MTLQIHSDASYLSVTKGRSCAGGHIYLGTTTKSTTPLLNSGAVLTISSIIKHVMSSAAEAEMTSSSSTWPELLHFWYNFYTPCFTVL